VRPDRQRGGDGVQREVARPPAPHDARAAEHRQRREERLERVAACLLAVPDEDRREDGQQRRDHAGAAIEELRSQRVDDGHQQRARGNRRDPHRQVAVADRSHDDPQQDVVQRRMAIAVGEILDQLGQAEVRLAHADRLVEPQPARDRQADRHGGEEEHGDDNAGLRRPHVARPGQTRATAERERLAVDGPPRPRSPASAGAAGAGGCWCSGAHRVGTGVGPQRAAASRADLPRGRCRQPAGRRRSASDRVASAAAGEARRCMLREGDVLGVYKLDELVGRGVTGVMFRGRDTRLGRTVALRIVDPELASDPIVRTRLNRESTVLAQLDHPNVVPLYEATEIEERLCLSSRWVDGRSLAHLIRSDGPLEVRRAVRIVGQIAAALQAAHDLAVIHRVVKPSNVLVTRGDHAYLTDFCLARRSTDTAGLTAPEELLASVDYVAPEAISGDAVDHRVDVYGLGLVLFEALVGEVPFPRKVDAAKVYAHLSAPPPSIHERRPQVPPELDAVVRRALAKEPDDRQQSAAAFAREAYDAVELTAPELPAAGGNGAASPPEAPTPAPASAPAPAQRPPFGTPPAGQEKNVRAQSRRARRAAAAVDAAAHDEPASRSRSGARRHMRRAAAGLLIVAFLVAPSLLVLALQDEDAGPRTTAVGSTARGLAVAGERVWVADASGESLQATTVGAPRRQTRLALGAGRIRGVASRGHRLFVATDKALVDLPRGDLGRATRVSNTDPVGPLAVGGGSLWAATTRGKPELLRVEAGRIARIPLKARASALAVGAGTLWIAHAGAGTVFGVDTGTRIARTTKVRVGRRPIALAATAEAVWVVLAGDSAIVRLDSATGRPNLPPVPVPGGPVAIAADSRQVWVARRGADAVTRLDARTGRPLDEIGAARSPVGVALSDDAAWVVGAGGQLTRIPR
jgi:serine/threonine protein kinase